MGEPSSAESTVFEGPFSPGRWGIDTGPFVFRSNLYKDPPGFGNESISGSTDPMLAWKSSKLTGGRKSNDDSEVSRSLVGAVEAKLNLELLPEACLEWDSCEALVPKDRCDVCWLEKPL